VICSAQLSAGCGAPGLSTEYSPDQRGLAAVDENFSEAMSNGIISPLRAKYLDLINRRPIGLALWRKSRFGGELRNQIRDIRVNL